MKINEMLKKRIDELLQKKKNMDEILKQNNDLDAKAFDSSIERQIQLNNRLYHARTGRYYVKVNTLQ